jgi:hypothetical protein
LDRFPSVQLFFSFFFYKSQIDNILHKSIILVQIWPKSILIHSKMSNVLNAADADGMTAKNNNNKRNSSTTRTSTTDITE